MISKPKQFKPCPFCGSSEILISSGCNYAECKKCGTLGPSYDKNPFSNIQHEIRHSLITDLWNKRIADDT